MGGKPRAGEAGRDQFVGSMIMIDVGGRRFSAVVALVGGNGGRTVPEQVDRQTSVRCRDEFDRRIPDGCVRVDAVDPEVDEPAAIVANVVDAGPDRCGDVEIRALIGYVDRPPSSRLVPLGGRGHAPETRPCGRRSSDPELVVGAWAQTL